MRKKIVDIRTMQAQERIEEKIDFMLRAGGINPDTLQPFTQEELKAEFEKTHPEPLVEPEAGAEDVLPSEVMLDHSVVSPEDQAIASEPLVEPEAEAEEKPKSRSRR